MKTNRLWLIAALAFLGAGALGSKSPPKKELPPNAPRPGDFASDDPKVLAMHAMIQLSRELQAAGQTNAAKVVMDQAGNPPVGVASRALQRVAAEFEGIGETALAAKLRRVQAQHYPEPNIPTA